MYCILYIPTGGGTYGRALKTKTKWPEHGMILWIHGADGLPVERGLHEPGDGPREEVLIVKADVARHGSVSLPEDLRHALELGAHVDETV